MICCDKIKSRACFVLDDSSLLVFGDFIQA